MVGSWKYYRRLAVLYGSYRRRDLVVAAPPLRLWLEISSRCNLRCPSCPNQELPAAQKGDMPWALYRRVVDQAREFALEVNLHHRGETLLHPDAGRMVRYAAEAGLPCRLHTNATLLRGGLADELLHSGLQRLSVSFDGFAAATYEARRVGARFAEVRGNVADFLERRRRARRRLPRLSLEVLEPAAGDDAERRRFAADMAARGLDELIVKKAHNWGGYLGSPPAGPVTACTFPWNALLVLSDGGVLPCAQDFFATLRLGSANEQPLLAIWNGGPMQRLRQACASGDIAALPAVCAACDRIRRPVLGGVPAEYLRRLLRRRMP
jgi:hypothetical protein